MFDQATARTLPEGRKRDKLASEFSKGVLTITLSRTAEAQKPV
jgi:HSP20 family molecular chaperone IbpA